MIYLLFIFLFSVVNLMGFKWIGPRLLSFNLQQLGPCIFLFFFLLVRDFILQTRPLASFLLGPKSNPLFIYGLGLVF
jgi:hypothetical protein